MAVEVCLCGTLITQPFTGRNRHYCSDRCRKRAQRVRNVTKLGHKTEDIRLYCGIGELTYNHHPIACGPYACISPVRGCDDSELITAAARRNTVSVPEDSFVIQDSGAFSDGPKHRLSYADALQRQKDHARYYRYTSQITHRASYDQLIDEGWEKAFRHKQRWSEEAGIVAVRTTVEAAAYLSTHRSAGIGCILSAQGVTTTQYLDCAEKVLSYLDKEQDIFGLGGWCILGKKLSLLPTFRETISVLIPLLASSGVKRVHIWGVCFTRALGELLWLCDLHGLSLSTDSIGPAMRPIIGEWGYGSWRDPSYKKPAILDSCRMVNTSGYKAPSCSPNIQCMGQERVRHIALTRDWLAHFRERESNFYRPVALSVDRQRVP